MSASKPEHDDKESFVEAFKSIPPIPKAKNEPPKVAPALARKPIEEYTFQPLVLPSYGDIISSIEKPKNNPDAVLATLMQALNFSSKELAMNREGEFSQTQKKRFRLMILGGVGIWVGVAGFLVLLMGLVLSTPLIRFVILFIAPFFLFVLVTGWGVIENRRKDIASSHVISYTGRVRKHHSDLIVINHKEETEHIFVVGEHVYKAFVDGMTYTFYMPSFAPTTILSVEPVSDAPKWSL
jgi:hypothetical protein